jgi:His-Xaa-Ser system protein HxsD
MPTEKDLQGTSVDIEVSTDSYPLAAIHRAVYWLADVADATVISIDDCRARITIRPTGSIAGDALTARLMRSLNDFALRLDVEERTRAVREKIVAAALAGLSPVNPK